MLAVTLALGTAAAYFVYFHVRPYMFFSAMKSSSASNSAAPTLNVSPASEADKTSKETPEPEEDAIPVDDGPGTSVDAMPDEGSPVDAKPAPPLIAPVPAPEYTGTPVDATPVDAATSEQPPTQAYTADDEGTSVDATNVGAPAVSAAASTEAIAGGATQAADESKYVMLGLLLLAIAIARAMQNSESCPTVHVLYSYVSN